MITVNRQGNLVAVNVNGLEGVVEGQVVTTLDYKPAYAIKTLAGYWSNTKQKERHGYLNIDTDGNVFFTNIDAENTDINCYLVFFRD